jgi:RHS repeat-associated protein
MTSFPSAKKSQAASRDAARASSVRGLDNINQKFTGQERDSESNLDYFHARYFGGALGRFLSPDPGNAGADPMNPQSWNAYAYVGNNPLGYTDPRGMASPTWPFINFINTAIWDVIFGMNPPGPRPPVSADPPQTLPKRPAPPKPPQQADGHARQGTADHAAANPAAKPAR